MMFVPVKYWILKKKYLANLEVRHLTLRVQLLIVTQIQIYKNSASDQLNTVKKPQNCVGNYLLSWLVIV